MHKQLLKVSWTCKSSSLLSSSIKRIHTKQNPVGTKLAGQDAKEIPSYERPLEWRESVLQSGTILYKHPSVEEILAVKQGRLESARALAISERLSQNKLEQETAATFKQLGRIPLKTKQEIEKQESEAMQNYPKFFEKTLSAEQILEAKKFRLAKPEVYTAKRLAQMYGVRAQHIDQVTKEPYAHVKKTVRKQREFTKNRARSGSLGHVARGWRD